MDLKEISINASSWVDSTQDTDYWRALVNAALNFRVPYVMELVNWTKLITFLLIHLDSVAILFFHLPLDYHMVSLFLCLLGFRMGTTLCRTATFGPFRQPQFMESVI